MNSCKANRLRNVVIGAAIIGTVPAWAQTNTTPPDPVLQRIDALTRELEQLKAQVQANAARADRAEADMKALAARAVPTPPVNQAADESLSRQATAIAATTNSKAGSLDDEPEGIELIKSAKASLRTYGMIDVGVEKLHGTLADGHQADAVRISNGTITPHFGVIGTGALGNSGLQGSFNLEGSFAPDNGLSGIGGRLFGRQAWVGITGPFGTIRLGRQYTMVRMAWEDANPYGTGNQGLRLLDPRISNPRADNSISYIGKWRGFSGGLNYSAGWDGVNGNAASLGPANNAGANCPGEVPDAEKQCKEWSGALKYDTKGWGFAGSFERLYGGTAATFGLTSPLRKDKRLVLGGYVKLAGGTKLTAGWIGRNNEGSATTPKSDMYWTEGVFPVANQVFIDALLAELKYKNSPNKALLANLRGRYIVSADTTLYVTSSFIKNSGTLALPATASTPLPTPAPGRKQASVIAGVLYKF